MNQLVGLEPIKNIFLMEDHAEAYAIWEEARIKNKILVHIDAHIDFGWRPDRKLHHLLEAKSLKALNDLLEEGSVWDLSQTQTREEGLSIYFALKNNLISEFYWVVPDAHWGTYKQCKIVKKMIRHIPLKKTVAVDGNYIIAEFDDIKIFTCRLWDLPRFQEDVLLDIDLDFLVIKSVSQAGPSQLREPWFRPAELVDELANKKICTDLVTIAYSVDKGFTPAKYKYLGNELYSILKNPVKGT